MVRHGECCRSGLSVLVLLSFTGCSDYSDSPYEVLDSGLWAGQFPANTIFWLDDERIIFVGRVDSTPFGRTDIVIWSLTGSTKVFRKDAGGLCYRLGNISYVDLTDKKLPRRISGRFQDKQTLAEEEARYVDKVNCEFTTSDPRLREGRSLAHFCTDME